VNRDLCFMNNRLRIFAKLLCRREDSRVTNHDSQITSFSASPAVPAGCAVLANFFHLVKELGAWLTQFFTATMFQLSDGCRE
jgi:hypothetical protein